MERSALKKKLQIERLTPQRELLFHLVKQHTGHLHVSELYRLARKKDPTINLATIYRTLKEFKKAGIVEELHLEEEHHHYETKEKEAHHHFICEKCGAILDFPFTQTNQIKKKVERQHGYVLSHIGIQATGLCKTCQKNKNI